MRVADGSLYGSGTNESLKAPPGASTSLNSPGSNGVSSSLILSPRALKPAGRFAKVPASISCLSAPVAVLDRTANHVNQTKAVKAKAGEKLIMHKILSLSF